MAIIPLFRVIVFTFLTLLSFVVLGICAHIEYLVSGYTVTSLSFAAFGLTAACLTSLSLPLFLALGNLQHRVFTSMILFEIVWFFILWVLWVGTAGDTVADATYHFPGGCVYNDYPTANQICYEFTVVEAFSFLNFFCAFVYYDVIFLYAIISAIRGKGIWTLSVKEAATGTPVVVNPGVPMVQPQLNASPDTQYQTYSAYPSNVAPTQPYNGYPQQASPQGPVLQQYSAYPQQASPYSVPIIPPGQLQPHYLPSPGTPQQQANYPGYSFSPTTNEAPLPPQPNYNSYPTNGSQTQLPLPSGYQIQPSPPQPSPSGYGPHQSIPV